MKRRQVEWRWEHPEAQAAFAKWVGFPGVTATAREVDDMERLLDLAPPARILDVGCGTGRHALELATRGYDVLGIDVAETYIAAATQAARQAGIAVVFQLRRGSEIVAQSQYDAVLAVNHTLGFMDDEELRAQFGHIARALRPSGQFLLTTAGPQWRSDAAPEPVKNWGEKDGQFILSERRMDGRTRIEHNIVIDTEKNEIVEYHEEQRAFAREEVEAVLRNAGFTTIDCRQDLAGNAANDDAFGVYICTA